MYFLFSCGGKKMSSSLKKSRILDLEKDSVEKYSECPKYVTIIRHADREDDSKFHCVPFQPFTGPILPGIDPHYQRNFLVPGQEIITVEDLKYGLFSITKVLEKENGPEYWLVASVHSRMGFLIPFEKLPQDLILEEVSA